MNGCGKWPSTTSTCCWRWCSGNLLAFVLFFAGLTVALDSCGLVENGVIQITADCVWRSGLPAPLGLPGAEERLITVQGLSLNVSGPFDLPAVSVAADSNQHQAASAGWALRVERVMLQGVLLPDPGAAAAAGSAAEASLPPVLWPVNLLNSSGSSLLLRDVRLVTSLLALQQHVAFFNGQLTPQWQLYTDNTTFLHVTSWTGSRTTLQSVTIMAGACTAPQAWPQSVTSGSKAAAAAGVASCGVFAASNATLVPLLAEQGSVSSTRPLLVLLQQNATLASSVRLNRPVAVAGLVSVVTSIDFGMRVNQLDVTSPTASLAFSSVVLENNAPGDVQSALVAAPYSVLATICLWSVYCFRDDPARPCTQLQNVTLVVGERDLDYMTLMFSMFSSPLPGVKRMTDFYTQDLNFTHLDFAPGPGPNAITVVNASSLSWNCLDCVMSSSRVAAPALPQPMPQFLELDAAAGSAPLVVQVYSCDSLKAAMLQRTIPNRLHVWLLTNSIDLAPAEADNRQQQQQQLSPAVAAADARRRARQGTAIKEAAAAAATQAREPLAAADPRDTCLGRYPIINYRTQVWGAMPGQSHASVPEVGQKRLPVQEQLQGMATLRFAYTRNAIFLPSQQPGQLVFVDVVLSQLPQGANPAELAAASASGMLPPQAWTFLFWAVNSSVTARAVQFRSCVMMLPEPEYAQLSGMAARNKAFMVELKDHPDALTFKDASQHGNHLHVGWVEGPGILGENLTLMADSSAEQDMPGGYFFDASAAERASNAGGMRHKPVKPQVLAPAIIVPVVVLLGAGIAAFVWRQRQRRQQQKLARPYLAKAPGSSRTSEDVLYATQLPRHLGQRLGQQEQKPAAGNPGNSSGQATSSAAANAASPPEAPPLASSVASGLQRWRAAVSSTTVNLIQRRLAGADGVSGSNTSSKNGAALSPHPGQQQLSGGSSSEAGAEADVGSRRPRGRSMPGSSLAAAAAVGSLTTAGSSCTGRGSGELQLRRQLGQGSFGAVYLGAWQGNTVAVKVMNLPSGFLEAQDSWSSTALQQQQDQRDAADPPACPPHYAILEAVLSSMMSHPNIVQVYTFMLTPMLSPKAAGEDVASSSSSSSLSAGSSAGPATTVVGEPGVGSTVADIAAAARAAARGAAVTGWALKLVMEYCDEGTLREALDKRRLLQPGQTRVAPAAAILLLRDVAAAMLHLHSEGVIHGDLKAANVMLASGRSDPDGLWGPALGRTLTAKVADFGLAVPLGPADSHASLTARGTPTHMSPELFLSGRVSKASDVYSFGVCVYELVTGLRAFAGVPLPLLPHEVAVAGLRPEWPAELGPGYTRLQAMAAACCAQEARVRPSFSQIFDALQGWAVGRQDVTTPWDEQQQQQQQVASQSLQVQPQQSGLQDHRQLSQQQTKQQLQQKAGAASARITFQAMQAQQLQQHQQWLLQRQQQQQQQQLAASGAGRDVLQSPAGPAVTGAAAGGSAAAGVGLSRFGRIAWSEVSFEALAAGKGMADQQGAQGGDATQGGEAAGGL